MSEKKEYKGIDIFKFICALFVIAIHTEPGHVNIWLDRFIGILTRIAVPYFFVASGFFYNSNNNKNGFIKTFKRLVLLYLINIVIYIPFVCKTIYTDIINNLDTRYILAMLFDKLFISGVNPHLWYLPANIFALIVFYLLSKKLKEKDILGLSSVAFVMGCLFSTYLPWLLSLHIPFTSTISLIVNTLGTRNGLFYGLFFFSLGVYIKKNLPKKSSTYYFVMTILGYALLAFEAFLVIYKVQSKSTILWFAQIPLAYFLFCFSITLNTDNIGADISKILRSMSTLMYNLHYIFIYILSVFNISIGFIAFVYVTVPTLIISYIIIILSKKYKLLKYLY